MLDCGHTCEEAGGDKSIQSIFPKALRAGGLEGWRCAFAGYNFAFCREANHEGWARIECRNTSKLHLKPGTKPTA